MIYQFVNYLKTTFPTEIIYTNGRIKLAGQQEIPDRNVLVMETGGTEKPWCQRDNATIQILSRDFDVTKSRKLAYDIFEDITSRFGLILPGVTVAGTAYPDLQVSQISAIQLPYCLGADEAGRIEYTTNYQIYFVRT
jgi:hypothetical protein